MVIENKWTTIGKKTGATLGTPEENAKKLRSKFEALNISPKNTHIAIQNYCIEKGLTSNLKNELENDLDDMRFEKAEQGIYIGPELTENARYNLLADFSGACANELIKKMYE